MANTPKQTPLTVENFRKLLMPEINKQFVELREEIKSVKSDVVSVKGGLKSVRGELTKLAHTVNDLKETAEETNKRVKYIPTTEIYLASQDRLMKELKTSEVETKLTGTHYGDVVKRIEYIDKYLQIDSSLV